MIWYIASFWLLGYAYSFHLLAKWGKKANKDGFGLYDVISIALLSLLSWYAVYKFCTAEEEEK